MRRVDFSKLGGVLGSIYFTQWWASSSPLTKSVAHPLRNSIYVHVLHFSGGFPGIPCFYCSLFLLWIKPYLLLYLLIFFQLLLFFLPTFPKALVDWASSESNWIWLFVVPTYTLGFYLVPLWFYQENDIISFLGCKARCSISFGRLVVYHLLEIWACLQSVWLPVLVQQGTLVQDWDHLQWGCGWWWQPLG